MLSQLAGGGWQCAGCAGHFEDQAVDVHCCNDGRITALQLPAESSLLQWEARIEDATFNITYQLGEPPGSHAYTAARALVDNGFEKLIAESQAILGSEHWAVVMLQEEMFDKDLESCVVFTSSDDSDDTSGAEDDVKARSTSLDPAFCERLWKSMDRLWDWYEAQVLSQRRHCSLMVDSQRLTLRPEIEETRHEAGHSHAAAPLSSHLLGGPAN